jgi:hypothetical protein
MGAPAISARPLISVTCHHPPLLPHNHLHHLSTSSPSPTPPLLFPLHPSSSYPKESVCPCARMRLRLGTQRSGRRAGQAGHAGPANTCSMAVSQQQKSRQKTLTSPLRLASCWISLHLHVSFCAASPERGRARSGGQVGQFEQSCTSSLKIALPSGQNKCWAAVFCRHEARATTAGGSSEGLGHALGGSGLSRCVMQLARNASATQIFDYTLSSSSSQRKRNAAAAPMPQPTRTYALPIASRAV